MALAGTPTGTGSVHSSIVAISNIDLVMSEISKYSSTVIIIIIYILYKLYNNKNKELDRKTVISVHSTLSV